MLCFCIRFVNLGGPKYGFRQVFWLFGDSTLTIVHKNSNFNGTEIAVISLIIVRFWWSFFVFLVQARAIRICPETTPLTDMKYPTAPPTMKHLNLGPKFSWKISDRNNFPIDFQFRLVSRCFSRENQCLKWVSNLDLAASHIQDSSLNVSVWHKHPNFKVLLYTEWPQKTSDNYPVMFQLYPSLAITNKL